MMTSKVANASGSLQSIITKKLTERLEPSFLDVVCESNLHNVPPGTEKHFFVRIVSKAFEGLRTIQMHRMVNECLADELAGPLHALRIDAKPPSKFTEGPSPPPPACRGGGSL
ncbi:hypothetical protein AB6A40_008781 [Gnathostoma spinigerum]|uniref:BolA-like protein 1 n=1 Tax=Gnathostoma spinigerum TaxID=75299 RepID=A0ABD6EZH3_9BILA